jgi:hypothetical protein
MLLARHSRIKFSQIVLSALVTGGFVSTFFEETSACGKAIGFVISVALLMLNSYIKDYDLGELAQKYLSLLTDLRGGLRPSGDLLAARDALMADLHAAYGGSPSTTYAAYRKAQAALQKHQDMTFSDDEIDNFLPGELKRASQIAAGSE